jgi:DNA invertase Pin-like site-specific DNA recombinase
MRVKYNRVSTSQQSGDRYEMDTDKYDLTLFDKVSGTFPFFEREKGKELKKLVEEGKVKELVVEEISRIGRNTGDTINVLQWLDDKEVNVYVRNLGLHSRPNGHKNPIWNMISSVMSSLYQMELENIKQRTRVGQLVYIQKGGVMGRKKGTNENDETFINKPKNKKILEHLKKEKYTIREISKLCEVSLNTIIKVKKTSQKLSLI